MQTAGLRTEDAPPLSIPLSFFLTAPIAVGAAGAVLMWSGEAALASRWSPLTLGLTHLGTLGLLTMVMLGALYQMMAVVVGSPVPWLRVAHGVHALVTLGGIGLVLGITLLWVPATWVAICALGAGLLSFSVPVGVALSRAESFNATSLGIAGAVVCLFATGSIGLWMAHGFAGTPFPGPRGLWVQVHLGTALLGWVGGLIAAVSWQVVPMFYLAREVPAGGKRAVLVLGIGGSLAPVVLLLLSHFGVVAEGDPNRALIAVFPAVLAVWFLHPALTWWSLAGRRRKRLDGSLQFWRFGLAMAPLTALAGALAWELDSQRWDLLFGWLAIWGWAGLIVHGMLTRIVPFLVWLHRFAPLIGKVPVPSVRKLLPDAWTRTGLKLHLAGLALGAIAIGTGFDPLCRLTGLALLATAGWMARSFLHVVRQPATTPDG